MNKRIKKKKIKYIIDNIQKVNLQDNDTLIFRYNDEKYSLEAVSRFAQIISEQVTKKAIFVPKEWDMVKTCEN